VNGEGNRYRRRDRRPAQVRRAPVARDIVAHDVGIGPELLAERRTVADPDAAAALHRELRRIHALAGVAVKLAVAVFLLLAELVLRGRFHFPPGRRFLHFLEENFIRRQGFWLGSGFGFGFLFRYGRRGHLGLGVIGHGILRPAAVGQRDARHGFDQDTA
jgi:hypothetical protein